MEEEGTFSKDTGIDNNSLDDNNIIHNKKKFGRKNSVRKNPVNSKLEFGAKKNIELKRSDGQYGLYNVYDGIYGRFLFEDFKALTKEISKYFKNKCSKKENGEYNYDKIFNFTANKDILSDDFRDKIQDLVNKNKITKLGAALFYANIDYIVPCLAKNKELLNIDNTNDLNEDAIVENIVNGLSRDSNIFSYMKEKWIRDIKTVETNLPLFHNVNRRFIDHYIINPIIAEIDTVVAEAKATMTKNETKDKKVDFIPEIVSRLLTEGSVFKTVYDALREYLHISKYLDNSEVERNDRTGADSTIMSTKEKVLSNVEAVNRIFQRLHEVYNEELSQNVGRTVRKIALNTLLFPIGISKGVKKIADLGSKVEFERFDILRNHNFSTNNTKREKDELFNLKKWSEREKEIAETVVNDPEDNSILTDDNKRKLHFRSADDIKKEEKIKWYSWKHRGEKDYDKIAASYMLLKYNIVSRIRLAEIIEDEIRQCLYDTDIIDDTKRREIELGKPVLFPEEVNKVCKKVEKRYKFERLGNDSRATSIPADIIKKMFFTYDDKQHLYSKTNRFYANDIDDSDLNPAIKQYTDTIKKEIDIFSNQHAVIQQAKGKLFSLSDSEKNEYLKKELERTKQTANRKVLDYFIGGQQSNADFGSFLTYALDHEVISDVAGICSGISFWSSFASTLLAASSPKWITQTRDENGNVVETGDQQYVNDGGFINSKYNPFAAAQRWSDAHNPFKKAWEAGTTKISETFTPVVNKVLEKTGLNKVIDKTKDIFIKIRTKVVKTLRQDEGHKDEVVGETTTKDEGVYFREINTSDLQGKKIVDENGKTVSNDGKLFAVFYDSNSTPPEQVKGAVGVISGKNSDGTDIYEIKFVQDGNQQDYINEFNQHWSSSDSISRLPTTVSIENDNYTEGLINTGDISGNENTVINNGIGQTEAGINLGGSSIGGSTNTSIRGGGVYQEPKYKTVDAVEEISYEGFDKNKYNNVMNLSEANAVYGWEIAGNVVSTGSRLFCDLISGLQVGLLVKVGLSTAYTLANVASGKSVTVKNVDGKDEKIKMYTRKYQRLQASMEQTKMISELQSKVARLTSRNAKVKIKEKVSFVYEMIEKVNSYKNTAADKLASLIEGYIYHYIKHRENAEPYSNQYKGKGMGNNIKRFFQWFGGLSRKIGARGLDGTAGMNKFRKSINEELTNMIDDFKTLKVILSPNRLFSNEIKADGKTLDKNEERKNISLDDMVESNEKERVIKMYKDTFAILFGTKDGIEEFKAENPFDTIINLALKKTVDLINKKYDKDFQNKAKLILEQFQDKMIFDKQEISDSSGNSAEKQKDKIGNYIVKKEKIIEKKEDGKIGEKINFYAVDDNGSTQVINPRRQLELESAKNTIDNNKNTIATNDFIITYDSEGLMKKVNEMYEIHNLKNTFDESNNKRISNYTSINEENYKKVLEKHQERQKRFDRIEETIKNGNYFHDKIYFDKVLDEANKNFDENIRYSTKLYRKNIKTIEEKKDEEIAKTII